MEYNKQIQEKGEILFAYEIHYTRTSPPQNPS